MLHILKKLDEHRGSLDEGLSETSTKNLKHSKKYQFARVSSSDSGGSIQIAHPTATSSLTHSWTTAIWAKWLYAEASLKFQETYCSSNFLCRPRRTMASEPLEEVIGELRIK